MPDEVDARVARATRPPRCRRRHPYPHALPAFGIVYGVPAFGFAMLWLMIAAATTLRTARRGLSGHRLSPPVFGGAR